MRRTPTSVLNRRLGAAAAVLLTGALLVGCGQENDSETAGDAAGESSETTTEAPPEETEETESAEEPAEGSDDEAASGDLPSWAPVIETEGEDVVGLDFSDIDPLSDELLVEEVVTGDGPPLEAGQTITADYYGQLSEADEPFDESFSSAPFNAQIGMGQLIPGWDQGLIGVPVGSRVIMSVPPTLGYGEQGSPPVIPGGATLFFVIDIIDAQ